MPVYRLFRIFKGIEAWSQIRGLKIGLICVFVLRALSKFKFS
jgi:hypothetical protein